MAGDSGELWDLGLRDSGGKGLQESRESWSYNHNRDWNLGDRVWREQGQSAYISQVLFSDFCLGLPC